jgi:hypothetical protein
MMQNPRVWNSPMIAPLNRILGSEASVRILRAICEAGAPLSRSSLAQRAGLSLPGTSAAVAKLLAAGILESVGEGARQSVQLREENPLALPLRMLFTAESLRWTAMLDELRSVVAAQSPPPTAVWIIQPAANAAHGAPLLLEIVAHGRDLPRVTRALQDALQPVEQRYDVTIELRALTEADLETAGAEARQHRERDAIPITGSLPWETASHSAVSEPGAGASPAATHAQREHQSWLRAGWIARRLDRDPTLPRRAREWLVHRSHVASGRAQGELDEWIRIVDAWTIPRIQHLLLDRGERATRLRQSNPFVPVLTREERELMQKETAG